MGHYIQFGTFCFWLNSKNGGIEAPNSDPVDPQISVKNEDGSNKTQLIGLEKFFPNMPKTTISFSPEKSGPPP